MTKNEILKKIGIIIIELRDQYDLIQLNSDDIIDIELELFVANSHFLTDHVEILRKLNNQQQALPKTLPPPPPPAEPTKYFEPVVKTAAPEKRQHIPDYFNVEEEDIPFAKLAQQIADAAKKDQTTDAQEEEQTPEPVIKHELVLDELEVVNHLPISGEEWDHAEEEQEEETVTAEPIENEPAAEPSAATEEIIVYQPEVINPQVIEEEASEKPPVTINQILSAQLPGAQRLASFAEAQPIKDLKSAIMLNDKLLFVRDLFNGYSMAYGEAIEILNRFNRFDEADQFLKINYYAKNNWEAKQATTDKFYQLLQRRFPE
ncbi:hypothetical protein BDD43_5834 [Mucilaginibacter gracilis]|uniref:Uncharacterized protein n=1 Tax=Mucilaginibacter gracilis TaxID=423350 RepID=A0A495J9T0_9SPHI|nr:hypothetical protein [Mucilaginibacter gracilis]RKR85563.1 hypothetical protein BDD43_5834 [Mucilaginibacter gracilis]